ncbi:MAG TPA: ankyrin repeat domain-containing protein [Planctomycetota bacterium]
MPTEPFAQIPSRRQLLAILAEDWERVEALAAADPGLMNAAHAIGGNPLYASARVGGVEQYRLRSLGCDSDGRPEGGDGRTPGRAAMECADPVGAWIAGIDLLSNGGDVNAPQRDGDSVLHGAVRARDARLVETVLRKGGAADARDAQGRTPLELAGQLRWSEGAALLRNHAAVPRDHRASRMVFNASREAFTLLGIDEVPAAVQSQITGRSHFDAKFIAEQLGKNPRLVHSISTDSELAIEACGHTGARPVIRIHLDHGAPLSLPTAISLGDLEHARWLLQGDPLLVHERGPHDFPVLWYPAIGQGSVAAAELLLEFGAPLEQESGGETALHWAALRGHPDLCVFLVEHGADPRAVGYRQDRSGRTPVQLAQDNGHGAAESVLRQMMG